MDYQTWISPIQIEGHTLTEPEWRELFELAIDGTADPAALERATFYLASKASEAAAAEGRAAVLALLQQVSADASPAHFDGKHDDDDDLASAVDGVVDNAISRAHVHGPFAQAALLGRVGYRAADVRRCIADIEAL